MKKATEYTSVIAKKQSIFSKPLNILAITFAFCTLLSACDNKQETVSNRKPTIKIGVIYPMSGSMAKFGESAQVAEKIFFSDLKAESLKYNYEIIWEDNQFQATKAISAFNKLTSVDKIDSVLSIFSTTGLAIAPQATERKVFHINGSSNTSTADGVYNFIISYSPQEMTDLFAKSLNERNIKKIDLINANTTGMIELANDFEKSIKNYKNINIGKEYFINPGERDFRTIITQIKQDNPDIIALQLQAPEIDIFIRQLKEQNVSIPFTGLSAFLYLKDKNVANNMWYIDSAFPSKNYLAKYKEKTNSDTTNVSEYFYVMLQILVSSYESFDKKPTSKELSDHIRNTKELNQTVIGNVKILPEGYIYAKPSLIEVNDGKLVVIKN